MKKFLLGLFTIFYFGISTGATLQVHYCMGKMVNIDLVNRGTDSCHECRMKKMNGKKGCCHDEQKVIKIAGDQNSTDAAYQIVHYEEFPSILVSSPIEDNTGTAALFRDSQVPIYIRNCFFRI
jgi:hypothetical protein